MKTQAAVLWEVGGKWQIEELDLDPPGKRDVLVELAASGLCRGFSPLGRPRPPGASCVPTS